MQGSRQISASGGASVTNLVYGGPVAQTGRDHLKTDLNWGRRTSLHDGSENTCAGRLVCLRSEPGEARATRASVAQDCGGTGLEFCTLGGGWHLWQSRARERRPGGDLEVDAAVVSRRCEERAGAHEDRAAAPGLPVVPGAGLGG